MVSKVHVANRRQGPPAAEPGRGRLRVTAGGGGSGKGPERGGWGARASSPFLWNKGKSVSEASVTPGRAKAAGRVGPATGRKFVRAGTLSRRRGAEPHAAEARGPWGWGRTTWSLGAGLGGRCGGGSPAPSSPLPLRAEFGAQSRARTLRLPRAPKRQPAPSSPGRGWEPNFSCPGSDT